MKNGKYFFSPPVVQKILRWTCWRIWSKARVIRTVVHTFAWVWRLCRVEIGASHHWWWSAPEDINTRKGLRCHCGQPYPTYLYNGTAISRSPYSTPTSPWKGSSRRLTTKTYRGAGSRSEGLTPRYFEQIINFCINKFFQRTKQFVITFNGTRVCTYEYIQPQHDDEQNHFRRNKKKCSSSCIYEGCEKGTIYVQLFFSSSHFCYKSWLKHTFFYACERCT